MTNKSIIVDRLDRCLICGSYYNIEIHHVFFGKGKRELSDRYKIIVPLCFNHHRGTNGVHGKNGHKLDLELKKLSQKAFEYKYPNLNFLDIFHKNYLYEEEEND